MSTLTCQEGKDFSLNSLFTATVLCGALLKEKQTNKLLGLKKLDSCSF